MTLIYGERLFEKKLLPEPHSKNFRKWEKLIAKTAAFATPKIF